MTRYFFVHMMKTAGTSLFFMLQRQIPRQDIYPPKENVENLSYDMRAAIEEIHRPGATSRLVSGHYPLSCIEGAPGEWKSFTLLRHPVQRTLSALRKQSGSAPGATMESVYDDPIRFGMWFDNYMVKVLGVPLAEFGDTIIKSEQRHLDLALAALEKVDVVGVSEDFGPFVSRLESAFGWDLGECIETNRSRPSDVSQSLLDRVCEDNRLDLELYDHVRRTLGLPALDEVGEPLG